MSTKLTINKAWLHILNLVKESVTCNHYTSPYLCISINALYRREHITSAQRSKMLDCIEKERARLSKGKDFPRSWKAHGEPVWDSQDRASRVAFIRRMLKRFPRIVKKNT